MPLYYFHIHDGVSLPDTEGSELPDLAAVRRNAIGLCGETIRELGQDFWDESEWRMDVTDATGRVLLTLGFFATCATSMTALGEVASHVIQL